MIADDRNRVRWLVLGLSQDGACMDLYENHSENSLKGDLSNDTTVNPPLFSLDNTFKAGFKSCSYGSQEATRSTEEKFKTNFVSHETFCSWYDTEALKNL